LEKLHLEIGQCLSHLESSVCQCGSGLLGSGPLAGKASNNKFQKGKAKSPGVWVWFWAEVCVQAQMKGRAAGPAKASSVWVGPTMGLGVDLGASSSGYPPEVVVLASSNGLFSMKTPASRPGLSGECSGTSQQRHITRPDPLLAVNSAYDKSKLGFGTI
jgi:hypothetical protein